MIVLLLHAFRTVKMLVQYVFVFCRELSLWYSLDIAGTDFISSQGCFIIIVVRFTINT